MTGKSHETEYPHAFARLPCLWTDIACGRPGWFNAVPKQEWEAHLARFSGADRPGTRQSQALPPTLVVAAQQSGG
jgi:hypothetical protein